MAGKSSDNVIQLDKYIENPEEIEGRIDRERKVLEEMNNLHKFIHSYNGKPMVLSYIYNDVYDKEVPEFAPPETLKVRYANKSVEVGNINGKKADIEILDVGSWWLKHPEREDYQTIGFDPKQEKVYYRGSSKILNMWDGFAIPMEYKKNGWRKFLAHIYKILCNKDHAKFKYVIKWFAWLIQNPGKPAEVCLVFKGKQGAGKSLVLNQFLTIFGFYGMKTGVRNHLTGQYNAHLQFKCFLLADEAYYPGDREVEGTLKQLITEHKVTIEPKFVNAKLSNNCLHICMSTNNDWVIPANEDERRYFVNKVEDTYAMNQAAERVRRDYFKPIYEEMDNGGREAMLFDLNNYKLGNWHPRFNIPKTEELSRQVFLNMNKSQRCLGDFINAGIFPGYRDKHQYLIDLAELTRNFIDSEQSSKYISNRAVLEALDRMEITQIRKGGEIMVAFPDLKECRRLWDANMGKYPWKYFGDWDVKGQATSY